MYVSVNIRFCEFLSHRKIILPTTDWRTYGTKLLQQHGWKEGCGLGTSLQGSAEPVPLTFKPDTRGIGCPASTETWIGVQNDFADVLKNLNSIHANTSSALVVSPEKTPTRTSHQGEKQTIEDRARGRGKLL